MASINMTSAEPDLSKVLPWMSRGIFSIDEQKELLELNAEARAFIEYYNWCDGIKEEYIGLYYYGIICVFLFKIKKNRQDVDDWIWVVVGDLPPTYLTIDHCKNPACALDGYIGAMEEWVEAAEHGRSVANLIPVNVPATPEYAEKLRIRLKFLDDKILINYKDDLLAE